MGRPSIRMGVGGSDATVPVAQLAPALAWLRDRAGVSIGSLSAAFGITPNHVRQLLYRQRHGQTDRQQEFNADPVRQLGIRNEEYAGLSAKARDRRLSELMEEVARIRTTYQSSSQFLVAASHLKDLQQFRGYPSDPQWHRFMGRAYHERAWFLVHAGHTRSAIAAAWQAFHAWRLARKVARTVSQAKSDLQNMADAALVVSHAHLLRHEPERALRGLRLVESVYDAGRLPFACDAYRQRGVAFLQLRQDDLARVNFGHAALVMARREEVTAEVESRYAGPRHTYLLARQPDEAFQLVADVAIGQLSPLHQSVASHWAVASALSTDSTTAHDEALTLLERNASLARAFGHQQTIALLLERTLALALPGPVRADWVRVALYQNAFRSR